MTTLTIPRDVAVLVDAGVALPVAAGRRSYRLGWCFGCVAPTRRRARTFTRLAQARLFQLCPACTTHVRAVAAAEGAAPATPGWIDPDETRAILDPSGRPVDPWLALTLGAAA